MNRRWLKWNNELIARLIGPAFWRSNEFITPESGFPAVWADASNWEGISTWYHFHRKPAAIGVCRLTGRRSSLKSVLHQSFIPIPHLIPPSIRWRCRRCIECCVFALWTVRFWTVRSGRFLTVLSELMRRRTSCCQLSFEAVKFSRTSGPEGSLDWVSRLVIWTRFNDDRSFRSFIGVLKFGFQGSNVSNRTFRWLNAVQQMVQKGRHLKRARRTKSWWLTKFEEDPPILLASNRSVN